jgi:hypothetical protein
MYIYVCVYMYTHTHMHACMHAYIHSHHRLVRRMPEVLLQMSDLHTCTVAHTHMHICPHGGNMYRSAWSKPQIRIHIPTHIHRPVWHTPEVHVANIMSVHIWTHTYTSQYDTKQKCTYRTSDPYIHTHKYTRTEIET